jgi:hypothetical protein
MVRLIAGSLEAESLLKCVLARGTPETVLEAFLYKAFFFAKERLRCCFFIDHNAG